LPRPFLAKAFPCDDHLLNSIDRLEDKFIRPGFHEPEPGVGILCDFGRKEREITRRSAPMVYDTLSRKLSEGGSSTPSI
jgi:hypothetical protein